MYIFFKYFQPLEHIQFFNFVQTLLINANSVRDLINPEGATVSCDSYMDSNLFRETLWGSPQESNAVDWFLNFFMCN